MLNEVGRSFTEMKAEKDTSMGPGINTKLYHQDLGSYTSSRLTFQVMTIRANALKGEILEINCP